MPSVETKEAVHVKCWHIVITQQVLAATVIIIMMNNILAYLLPVLGGESHSFIRPGPVCYIDETS